MTTESWAFLGSCVLVFGTIAVAWINNRKPEAPHEPVEVEIPHGGGTFTLSKPDPTGAVAEVVISLGGQIAELRETSTTQARRIDTLEGEVGGLKVKDELWRRWHREDHALHESKGWPILPLPEGLQ